MYLSQALLGQISLFEDEANDHYEISGTLKQLGDEVVLGNEML